MPEGTAAETVMMPSAGFGHTDHARLLILRRSSIIGSTPAVHQTRPQHFSGCLATLSGALSKTVSFRRAHYGHHPHGRIGFGQDDGGAEARVGARSEERRVGKERRAGWGRERAKRKRERGRDEREGIGQVSGS